LTSPKEMAPLQIDRGIVRHVQPDRADHRIGESRPPARANAVLMPPANKWIHLPARRISREKRQ
jgi:hypothetical protein